MAEIQTIIGSLPVCRGQYEAEVSYFRDNQVTMYGSTFQSIADDNVGYPPAEERDDGKVYAINTDKWIIVANALAAYNAGKRIDDLAENTEIKDEEGNVQDTPFRVISNEEFLKAIVDSDDKVLFGFYRATGKPYYPLNEMYHVIQNEEYFAAWVTTDEKVVLGLRRDGEVIGEIHAVKALKQVIAQLQADFASLQEKVGTIDSNLKELLDVFSLQENPEYLAVEKDADGKVLSATYNDGSHYSHNLKSETIDAKVDKEKGKSLIDADVAIANTTMEDPEERSNMELDSENRVLSHRDKNGIKNENVGFNTPNYYKNGEKCEWIEESDVMPIVKKSDDIPLGIIDGVTNHNTPNLIVPSGIQKTFNDGTTSFSPPNAGYELSLIHI